VVQQDDVKVHKGGNFTNMKSHSFGSDCVDIKSNPKPEPSACIDTKLTLTTDDFPVETSVSLTDTIYGSVYWTDTDIDEVGATYEWTKCIDPEGCHLLTIGDSYGDGLEGEGFTLIYGGEEVVSDRSFGFSFEHYLGNGCQNK